MHLLVDKGADVNAKTSNGVTPLYLVANGSSYEALQLLVKKEPTFIQLLKDSAHSLQCCSKVRLRQDGQASLEQGSKQGEGNWICVELRQGPNRVIPCGSGEDLKTEARP
jgi:hypothetical protein